MDIIQRLKDPEHGPITCVEMHTTGEPTRVVIKGYPSLTGTLLQQRADAKLYHDHIRKRLMLEPRGHADMYGAILRPETELTKSGEAHIGVLFTHNDGYSTMCGHATIALGRFLLDTHDVDVFPARDRVKNDPKSRTSELNLHAPCGLVKIIVPTTPDGTRSDPSRPVAFISVPSFSTGIDVKINIPQDKIWPELDSRRAISVSFSYGGAFSCLVSAHELGFGNQGLKTPVNYDALCNATMRLKSSITSNPSYHKYFEHPLEKDLSSLYTTIVVDKAQGIAAPGSLGAETGLCYFADQQADRSPTGSAVAARVALAYTKGELRIGEPWTYHSLVSNMTNGKGGFVGQVMEEALPFQDQNDLIGTPVRVKVEGYAYYVGTYVFVAEQEDPLADEGFLFKKIGH